MNNPILKSLLCIALLVIPHSLRAESIANDLGWTLNVDAGQGEYSITLKDPAWRVGGSIGKALTDLKSSEGSDRLGAYRQIAFRWREEAQRSGSIRVYRLRPIAIFTVTFDEAVNRSPIAFPILNQLPEALLEFRYGEKDHLGPILFQLQGKSADEQYGGPFTLFDNHANTMILSPASNFMVAMLSGDQKSGLSSGLNRTLQGVPAGYTHQTILAVDRGINHTWDVWGEALTDLYAKKRPSNDADAGLKYIGYWTDNGAHYYYNYELDKGYEGTLLAIKKHLASLGIPIGYVQLDSWWYPKTLTAMVANDSNKPRSKNPSIPASTWNRYGGLIEYTPHPELFPGGLAAFCEQLGIPLVTHNRWIDPESPYHSEYKISGVASIDPKWWDKIAADIASWGVMTYEQDWLNYLYTRSPELSDTTTAGDAFMDAMANACAKHNLTMQYCMVLPRHMMQGGAKYPNLTTVRVSGDRLNRGKWREFLFGSRMPAALGVWPWSDVFRSKETSNMLVCTLSAGMVGLADQIGQEDTANIFRAIRKDGVIIKPDVPMTPTDATFISEGSGDRSLIVAATHTTHTDAQSDGTTAYVFAFAPNEKDAKKSWSTDLKSIGVTGNAFAYDFFNGTGRLVEKTLTAQLNTEAWAYWIVAPVGESKMALIGDTGAFVTRGKQRIAAIHDDSSSLNSTILFAASDEEIALGLYAPIKPHVEVKNGSSGDIQYDSETKIARVSIRPAQKPMPGEVTRVEVTFKLPQE